MAKTLDKKKKKKRKKPEKKCNECGTLAHARSSVCKNCGYVFYIKKKELEVQLAKDWRDLKRGDVIKVITGSGPYYLSKDNPGEKIMMGHKGKFEVLEIIDNGPKRCGIYGRQMVRVPINHREWIYMGESYYNDTYSMNEEPHRIRVLKKGG